MVPKRSGIDPNIKIDILVEYEAFLIIGSLSRALFSQLCIMDFRKMLRNMERWSTKSAKSLRLPKKRSIGRS